MSTPAHIPIQVRIARLLARRNLQRFWEVLYLISVRGLGYNNYISSINGEDRFVQEWLLKYLRDNLVVFDVGANIGEFTAFFSEHARSTCRFFYSN